MSAGPEEIAHAIARLRRGELVAFPSETVYGLGASAFNPAAVRRVFAVKGRPSNNPLIVHVSGSAMARDAAASWSSDADALARAFWPGPLSIIAPRAARIPDEVTGGGPTVAIRCPDHPITLALLDAFGEPLVGPSANPSGGVSPTRAEHVASAFSPDDVFVLDGGPCRGGIESTVVMLNDTGAAVLRPGLITHDEIARVLKKPVAPPSLSPHKANLVESQAAPHDRPPEPLASPGLLDRHYAPNSRAVRFESAAWPAFSAFAQRATGTLVLLTPKPRPLPAPGVIIQMPEVAEAYAAALYDSLRRADALAPALIAIELPDAATGIWAAIRDRLRRATTEWRAE
jgi:L-threonylcarbamoyladenylate synthase